MRARLFRALLLAGLAPLASADIVVQRHPRAGGSPVTTVHAPGAPIALFVDDSFRRVNIFAQNPAAEDIGPVTIEGAGSQQIYIIVGEGDQPTMVPAPGARDLLGLDVTRGNMDLVGNIAGDVRGLVRVPRIVRFDAAGGVRAPIEQTWANAMWLELGRVEPGGAVRALAGNVQRLGVVEDCLGEVFSQEGINSIVVGGDLRGDVTAMGGQIAQIVVGGLLGGLEEPTFVRSPSHISVTAGSIHADIEAGVGGGDGRIRELATTAGGVRGRVRGTRLDHFIGQNVPVRIAGDFDAELTITHSLRRELIIEGDVGPGAVVHIAGITRLAPDSTDEHWGALRVLGDVRGSVTIDQLQRNAFAVVEGDVAGLLTIGRWFDPRQFTASLTVGGRLTGALQVRENVDFPVVVGGDAPGTIAIEGVLTRPMLVNAALLGGESASGFWEVAGTALTQTPWYPEGGSGELGGGLIARAPFALHRAACSPADGSLLLAEPCASPPAACGIELRFYGPGAPAGAGGAGTDFVVQRRIIGSPGWTDVSLQYAADFFHGDDRTVVLYPVGVGSFGPGYVYRVRPRGSVRSVGAVDGVGAEESVWLTFQVGTAPLGCGIADLTTSGSANGVPDGTVDVSDYSWFLTLWSVGDPRADITGTGACTPGSGDGVVDVSDFSCYLTLWSAGCP